MQKHPLISIFKEKRKEANLEEMTPIAKDNVLTHIAPSLQLSKMGCLVLAGGQGTRLGIDGPKGCVVLPLKERKTLFQWTFERIKEKGKDLPVAVMTSPINHKGTMQYFEKHHYFGLTNVSVFSQDMIPVCDEKGNLCGGIKSPDGNGKALKHLVDSGIWQAWKEQGVEIVHVIPVDNPKAEPFDEKLLAVHEKEGVDLVLRCIRRLSQEEKLGVVGQAKGKLLVREYSELSEKMKSQKSLFGNTGLFSCTMDFALQAAKVTLPWHLAHKQVKGSWVWKFETFIFDLFPYAQSFKIMISNRRNCFAPLKNRLGPDSLETVAKALMT